MVSVDQLTTLHHAISEAQQEARGEAAMPTYTFRIPLEDRSGAEAICKQHGTTLAAYLRACVKLLPVDYKPTPSL